MMSDVYDGSFCVIVDGVYYKFLKNRDEMLEFINSFGDMESHEFTIKATPFDY